MSGVLVALATGLAAAAGCTGIGNPRLSESVRAWAAGPVHWLMLPAERTELARLANEGEAAIFVTEFWRRRDPDPLGDGNAARRRFEERVAAADRHYGEAGTRGSLTARGGALILLGPPHVLRQERRAVPAWQPVRGRGAPMAVRRMAIETWEYRLDDLPDDLALLLRARGEQRVVLDFAVGERVKLIDGDRFLAWAAEAMVRLAPAADATRQARSPT